LADETVQILRLALTGGRYRYLRKPKSRKES
jgi:hypothetical protein